MGPSAQTARNQYQRDASRQKLGGQTFDLGSNNHEMLTRQASNGSLSRNGTMVKSRNLDEKRGSVKPSHQQLLLKNAIANYSHQRVMEKRGSSGMLLDSQTIQMEDPMHGGDTLVVRNLPKRQAYGSFHSIETHRNLGSEDQPDAPKQHIPNKISVPRMLQAKV